MLRRGYFIFFCEHTRHGWNKVHGMNHSRINVRIPWWRNGGRSLPSSDCAWSSPSGCAWFSAPGAAQVLISVNSARPSQPKSGWRMYYCKFSIKPRINLIKKQNNKTFLSFLLSVSTFKLLIRGLKDSSEEVINNWTKLVFLYLCLNSQVLPISFGCLFYFTSYLSNLW